MIYTKPKSGITLHIEEFIGAINFHIPCSMIRFDSCKWIVSYFNLC